MNSFYAADLDVEALMYVYESASFEYENGNTEFAVFLEADDGTTGDQNNAPAASSNEGWFAKLKRATVTFIRSAIQAVRAMLNKLANKRRMKNAAKATAKAINKEGREANHQITITPEQNTYLANGQILGSINNFTNVVLTSLETAKTRAQGDTSWNEAYKEAFNSKVDSNTNKGMSARVGLNDIQRYLNTAVNMLGSLNAAYNNVNTVLARIKNRGYTTSQIRLATSYAYNYMTKVIRQYYNIAMEVAKTFSA